MVEKKKKGEPLDMKRIWKWMFCLMTCLLVCGLYTGKAEAAEPENQPVFAPIQAVMMTAEENTVYQLPSEDSSPLALLPAGYALGVTAKSEDGWYQVIWQNSLAYMKQTALREADVYEASAALLAQQTKQAENLPVPAAGNVVMIGDSRTGQMHNVVGENGWIWIAGYGGGIEWFRDYAVKQAEPYIGPGTKVIFNLGVNDPGHIAEYIETLNLYNYKWREKGATLYFATVGPVGENPYHTEWSVENFNTRVREKLDASIVRLDLWQYLAGTGFGTVDGLHYDGPTYLKMYQFLAAGAGVG